MTNEPSTTKRRAGEILSIGIVVYTLIVAMICLRSVNTNPRTDDAEVFANYIGIAPQVDGPIAKLYVKDNQFVHKGDLLMEIDDQPYRYALQHAKSEREALEGQIEDERRTIAAQTTSVAVAQTATRTADANVSRYAASVDEAKASVLNARAGLTRAQEDLNYASSNLGRIQPLLAGVDAPPGCRTGTLAAEGVGSRPGIGARAIRAKQSSLGPEPPAGPGLQTQRPNTRSTRCATFRKDFDNRGRGIQPEQLPHLCPVRRPGHEPYDLRRSLCPHGSTDLYVDRYQSLVGDRELS